MPISPIPRSRPLRPRHFRPLHYNWIGQIGFFPAGLNPGERSAFVAIGWAGATACPKSCAGAAKNRIYARRKVAAAGGGGRRRGSRFLKRRQPEIQPADALPASGNMKVQDAVGG